MTQLQINHFGKIPLDSDPQSPFYIRRLHPFASAEEMLDVVQIPVRAFHKDPLFFYMNGPRFRVVGYNQSELVRNTMSASEKLDTFIQRAKDYKRLNLSWLYYMHQINMRPGSVGFVLYKQATGDNKHELRDRAVSFVRWDFPAHMVPLIQPYDTWSAWLYRKWIQIKYLLLESFSFLGVQHPFHNERSVRFRQMEESFNMELYPEDNQATIDRLSLLTSQELTSTPYNQDSMVQLGSMTLDPDFQRQGLGNRFLSKTLEIIPNVPTPFNHSNGKDSSVGPQKILVSASEAGAGLYQKHGFKLKLEEDMDLNGTVIRQRVLERVVDTQEFDRV